MTVIVEPARPAAYAVGQSWTIPSTGPTQSNVTRNAATVANCTTIRNSNPNYRAQISKQIDAGTIYQRDSMKYSLANIGCSANWTYLTYPIEYRSVGGTSFGNLSLTFAPQDDSVLADIALKRLKGRLASDLKSYKALCPVAELGEMRGLIRSAAQLTTVAVKTLLDIKSLKSPKTAFKYAADAWLTFNFGFAPTSRDIVSLASSIDAYVNRKDHKVTVHGAANRQWVSSSVIGPWQPEPVMGNFQQLTNRAQFEHSLSYRFKAVYGVQFNAANNYAILEQLGFTLEDLPSAIWQFAAFSWVADYFGTIGSYLSDAFTSPPGNTIYVSKSRLYKCKYTGNLTWSRTNSMNGVYPVIFGSSAGSPTGDYWSYRRDPLATLPHLALRFKTQDEVGQYAVTKLLNLASLLVK